jgi:hypothetical protein
MSPKLGMEKMKLAANLEVIKTLADVMVVRGVPEHLCSENAPNSWPGTAEAIGRLGHRARQHGDLLYSEASIALEGYLILSPEAQFSQDEIRRIIAYARQRTST